MNAMNKFRLIKAPKVGRTPMTQRVYIGDWCLEQDEEGNLVARHTSGVDSYVIGVPPQEVTNDA